MKHADATMRHGIGAGDDVQRMPRRAAPCSDLRRQEAALVVADEACVEEARLPKEPLTSTEEAAGTTYVVQSPTGESSLRPSSGSRSPSVHETPAATGGEIMASRGADARGAGDDVGGCKPPTAISVPLVLFGECQAVIRPIRPTANLRVVP